MSEINEWPIDRFLKWIGEIVCRDDRGTLAELRRGLSVTTQERAWEHLIPFCKDFDSDGDHRAVWCTVGGLAAELVPDGLSSKEPWNNLGTTMRALAKGSGEGDSVKALKSFEPKFRRALSCGDTHSLCEMVVGIGRAASMKGVTVNLKVLFWDLWNWSDPDKREITRLKWAKQYFGVFESGSTAVEAKEGEDA